MDARDLIMDRKIQLIELFLEDNYKTKNEILVYFQANRMFVKHR